MSRQVLLVARLALLGAASALVMPAFAQTDGESSKNGALHPRVKMTTTLGDIVLELDAERAPISTLNFLQYCEDGFYNGKIFHRVIPNFMIQGGGYTESMDETKKGLRRSIFNEWRNGLKNVAGTIAMARTSEPNSATAQFFINVVDNDRLDQPMSGGAAYAVFGKVVEGMDTVEKIRNTPCIKHPKYPVGDAVTPAEAVVIQSASALDGATTAKVTEAIKKAQDKKVEDLVRRAESEGGKTKKTDSGLIFISMNDGEGDSPKPTDTVKVHYAGTFLNGVEFDSSHKRGQPATFPLNAVIKGWTEGVGMMKPGGKARLIIPSDLAYGPGGSRDTIPPNATLVFDIELIALNPE